MSPRQAGGAQRRGRPKWHYVYFLLAAFDLLTVSAGLYLTHEIMGIYTRSVAVNQLWTERAAEFSRLGDLASAVNAPGNDVFDTRKVASESAKMQAALVLFGQQVAKLRKEIDRGAALHEAAPLLAHLDRISAAMKQMTDEANLIFSHFASARPDLAGERMASMDRKFAGLNSAIAQLGKSVMDIQRQNFERQTAAAKALQQYESVIGLLILCMVIAATFYGHRIARRVQEHTEEKERHLTALSEAETRTRSILDTAADGILAFDAQGKIESMNKAAERLFGYVAGDAIGSDIRGLVDAEDKPTDAHPITLLLGNMEEEGVGTLSEVECRRLDGMVFPAEIAVRRMPLIGHTAYVCMVRDITERRRAELALWEERDRLQALNEKLQEAQSQLLQADKMASIGQLAAGVAHEINNPMAFIGSNLGSLRDCIPDLLDVVAAYEQFVDPILVAFPENQAAVSRAKEAADLAYLRDDLPQLLDETRDGVTRVRKIVQDLKEFSHVGVAEWHPADLHSGLDSTLNLVWNELKYKAQVVKEYGQLPPVECVLSQVNQVFMNLLVNAAHAIEEKGTITIRSDVQDGMAWVEIEDTGSGISPEHMKRIFEPFFTTKPVGKGTGLGLSLCYGIAKKHGGRIEVSSEVGRGSAFRVWLPIRRPEVVTDGVRVVETILP